MTHPLLKTILVIEDDAQMRTLFLRCLAAEGFAPIVVENGSIGVEQAQQQQPDVIICDIMMPIFDGYDVLNALRQDPATASIPFIFLTADHTKATYRKGMELGADDYLTKPFTTDELVRAIATRLQKQATLQHWYKSKLQFEEGPRSPVSSTRESPSIFPDHAALKEIFNFIELHYHQNITLSDVAKAVGYSPAYLTHRVAQQTGETINCWIVKRRMVAACHLLQATDYTVQEIALRLGYQNVGHFSRQFRQHHGSPPQTWRKADRFQVG
jgi:YesN/AraC family two-component response regulator